MTFKNFDHVKRIVKDDLKQSGFEIEYGDEVEKSIGGSQRRTAVEVKSKQTTTFLINDLDLYNQSVLSVNGYKEQIQILERILKKSGS